jgi:dihydroxy-acid dehydratase
VPTLIGIANSWNRVVPGHYNLNLISDYVKQGIHQTGGTPVEFGVIAACDGIAEGHDGMHFILPTRDLIANDIEMMIEAHRLDAVVLLGSCDKIVPGMLMAAARLDLPSILVVGGPMEGGCEFDKRAADGTSLTEAYAMLKAGKIDEATYYKLEDCAAPTCGSCSFLGTANTMCCAAEAMGMCLPGSATMAARLLNYCVAISQRAESSTTRVSRMPFALARRSEDRPTLLSTYQQSAMRRTRKSPWTALRNSAATRHISPR